MYAMDKNVLQSVAPKAWFVLEIYVCYSKTCRRLSTCVRILPGFASFSMGCNLCQNLLLQDICFHRRYLLL